MARRGGQGGPGLDLSEAESWLASRIDHERAPSYAGARLGLGPIRALLARLGSPERRLHALHVAGSKGKGSVALVSEALCRGLGARTGTFTSPHLVRWTERFRLDGSEVPGDALADAVSRVRPEVLALDEGPDAPTWFDVTTAVALLLFAEAGVDATVLEVGLGGRLDSTNAIAPAVSCITSIELEHTERLGATLAAIAGEKAGILKPGVPAVVGRLSAEALAAVQARAAAVGAPLVREGSELGVRVAARGLDGSALQVEDAGFALDTRVGAPGAHQAHNAALALACVRRLLPGRDAELAEVARKTLPTLQLPGRIELLGRAPWRVVDVAHTPASVAALLEVLAGVPAARTHAVLCISAGKDLPALCRLLAPRFDRFSVTRAEPMRSLAPEVVAAGLREAGARGEVELVPEPRAALEGALRAAGPDDLLCATGSFYLAGPARDVLRGASR